MNLLIFFWLISSVYNQQFCRISDSNCQCRLFNIECISINKTKAIFPTFTQLIQSNNGFNNFTLMNKNYDGIPRFAFSRLRIMIRLSLELNQLEFIDDRAYEGMIMGPNELILKSNRLKENNFRFLNNLNLTYLDLSYNEYEYISNFSFKLERINLSFNKIKFIDQNVFKGIKEILLDSIKLNSVNLTESLNLNLDILSLKSNEIKVLPTFNQSRIIYLDLSFNKISEIVNDCFNLLNNLKKLLLNDNLISIISSGAFENLKELEHLDISYNRINSIDAKMFENVSRLKYLSISNNKIENIETNIFSKLDQLVELDISNNFITVLNSGFLKGLKSLSIFMIEDNPIESIQKDAFIGSNLQKLSLNSLGLNNLENLALNGLENVTELSISMNKLEKLTNQSLIGLKKIQNLYFEINFIKTIDENTFSHLDKLQNLELSKNNFDLYKFNFDVFYGLSSLSTLYLTICEITGIRNTSFSSLKKLDYLDLENNSIEFIDENSFINQLNLRKLKMSFNKIQHLKNYFFKGLYSLKNLELKNNQISFIQPEAFIDLESIQEIDLSDNCIYYITDTLVLPSVSVLINYQENVLYILKDYSFEWTRLMICIFDKKKRIEICNSTELNLRKNEISIIEPDAFNHKHSSNISLSLLKLDLGENRIKSIDSINMLKLHHLTNLYLDGNRIRFINKKSFIGLKNLLNLDLSNNNITNLSFEAFDGLGELKDLKLNENRLKYLNNSLNSIRKLSSLNISFNELEIILFSDFNNLINLNQLDLSGNPKIKTINNANDFISTNIQSLYLKNVSIDLITSINFDKSKKLELLDLSLNELGNFVIYSVLNLNKLILKGISNVDNLFNLFSSEYLNFLDLSDNHLSINFNFSLTNKKLNYLYMKNCSLKSFNISFLLNLYEIDLSMNQLEIIKSTDFSSNLDLLKLNLSFNKISSIETGSFKLKLLLNIDLSHNFIEFLSKDMFEFELNNRIKEIYVNNNQLKHVELCLPFIQKINANQNHLTETSLILKCKKFYSTMILNFNNNKITRLNKDLPFVSKYITSLSLSNNKIEYIEPNTFVKMINIIILDLSHNLLGKSGLLDHFVFKGLYYFATFNLSYNYIEYIPKQLFQEMPNLETLDLSHNLIKTIEKGSFINLNLLKTLYLSFNDLNGISSPLILSGLHSIKFLHISRNMSKDYESLVNLKESLKVRFNKVSLNISYYNSIQIIHDDNDQPYSRHECFQILYLIRFKLHLNLIKSDKFLMFCRSYFDVYFEKKYENFY